MLNEHLEEAKRLLSQIYFCLFKEKNVLEVSLDKNDLPFLYLVVEDNDMILMSFSVEFSDVATAAQIALLLNNITDTEVTDRFYVNKSGEIFWNEDALLAYSKDNVLEYNSLKDMKPITDTKH